MLCGKYCRQFICGCLLSIFKGIFGNTDCHIKNYSLLYGENLKQISLAPAYDIVAAGFEPALSKATETLIVEGFQGVPGLKDRILETGGCRNM